MCIYIKNYQFIRWLVIYTIYMHIYAYLNCTFVSYDLGENQHLEYFFNSLRNAHFPLKGKLREGIIYKITQIIWTYV